MAIPFIDVSEYRNKETPGGALDFAAVREAGYSACMVRLTHGAKIDPYGVQNVRGARLAGLIVGIRHRLYGTPTVQEQFNLFHATAQQAGGVSGTIVSIDSEDNATWEQTVAFINLCRLEYGIWPLVYVPCWWLQRLGNPLIPVYWPWWHSRYDTTPLPLCGSRSRFEAWQYSATGRVPGVGGYCDLNDFYGSMEDLGKLIVPWKGAMVDKNATERRGDVLDPTHPLRRVSPELLPADGDCVSDVPAEVLEQVHAFHDHATPPDTPVPTEELV